MSIQIFKNKKTINTKQVKAFGTADADLQKHNTIKHQKAKTNEYQWTINRSI